MMSTLIERVKKRVASEASAGRTLSPVTLAEVEAVDAESGLALPTLLRTLYTQVGDGWFGPPVSAMNDTSNPHVSVRQPDEGEGGYGIIPVSELVSTLQTCRCYGEEQGWEWPEALLPFCSWGDEVYECVDCASGDGHVVHFDPNEDEGDNFDQTAASLEEWLEKWLSGASSEE